MATIEETRQTREMKSKRGGINSDLREVRRLTRSVKEIARDISEILGPAPADPKRTPLREAGISALLEDSLPSELPASLPVPALPEGFVYVTCQSCESPAILVRDVRNKSFGGLCLHCRTISHLETIREEQ